VARAEQEREQCGASKGEESVTDQNKQDTEKSEMRVMWIMTAVIVLIILGMTGMNMLTHPDWMHGG
jgi:hypothetical protein